MHRTAAALAALALALASAIAAAQDFPTRPVRMLIPYTPGGPTDFVGRALAQRLHKPLGQQVVVDNRPGGGGVIATEIVARANPDGHTILFATPGQLITLPLLVPRLPYEPLTDFMPLTKLVDTPQVLIANARLPVANVAELIAYARQRPGQLNYASVQTGGTGHLGMELLKQSAGIDMLHVPYKGTAPAMASMISGETTMTITGMVALGPHVKSKRLKLLGVATMKRLAIAPEVPTLHESGASGYDANQWYGVLTQAAVPRDIVAKLHTDTVKVMARPDVRERLAADGAEPVANTPEQFAAHIKSEIARWAPVVKASGAKPD